LLHVASILFAHYVHLNLVLEFSLIKFYTKVCVGLHFTTNISLLSGAFGDNRKLWCEQSLPELHTRVCHATTECGTNRRPTNLMTVISQLTVT